MQREKYLLINWGLLELFVIYESKSAEVEQLEQEAQMLQQQLTNKMKQRDKLINLNKETNQRTFGLQSVWNFVAVVYCK